MDRGKPSPQERLVGDERSRQMRAKDLTYLVHLKENSANGCASLRPEFGGQVLARFDPSAGTPVTHLQRSRCQSPCNFSSEFMALRSEAVHLLKLVLFMFARCRGQRR